MSDLHIKYAPILRFNKDEKFFPMRAEDMLAYSSLHVKGQDKPIVPRGQLNINTLLQHGRSPDVFLRSIKTGPFFSQDVVSEWGEGALEMVYRWAAANPANLAENLARKAYSWFTPKNKDAAQLFWWNQLVTPLLGGDMKSASGEELPRLVLPLATQDSAVEQYEAARSGYAYYYRQVEDGDYFCLQYWFFYSFNNWGRGFAGMNDHEGDWEGMMLFFRKRNGRPQEPPAYITFADHESRQTKPWGHHGVTLVGTHPVGFVGAGSHATYPEASSHVLMKLYNLVDHATGDGLTIDHDDWEHRVDLDETRWFGDYKGSFGTRFWLPLAQARNLLQVVLSGSIYGALVGLKMPAEIELPGVSAPRGPVGPHRPQYASPAAWAGVPAE